MFRPLLLAILLAAAPLPVLADCSPGFATRLPQIVRKADVAAVDQSWAVRLWEFCRGEQFHDPGNAAGVIRTIAGNGFLVEALAERGARPDDVNYVRLVGQTIDLWVHRN